MISGYPHRASVLPGERLVLHVATDSARFRVNFLRWANGFVPMQQSRWLPGERAPARGPADDWRWPEYEFDVPGDWPSGVYIAHLEEPGGKRLDLALDSAALLFVVRGQRRGGLLYKIPLATYHACNYSGGGCYDDNPSLSIEPPGSRVSLQRPGGGIGGATWGAADHYDASSPRHSFAHWDARFLRWLARNGYTPECCTDLDLDADPELLYRYRLLVCAGHDAYWSTGMRDAVEDFTERGGNAAFFAAGVCWWRVHFVDHGAAMVCHQGGSRGAYDLWWSPRGAGRPEDALSGASYRHGGGWWDGPRQTAGYTVLAPSHWAFDGTGLAPGDRLGAHTWPPLAGYACDGVPLDVFEQEAGSAVLSAWRDEDGTPDSYQLLAACPLGHGWQALPERARFPAGRGVHVAAMGLFRRGAGTVFSAGTTDWAQVLDSGRDLKVERITRNVLDRLLHR